MHKIQFSENQFEDINFFKYYNENYYQIDDESYDGTVVDFCEHKQQIPQLIVKTWNSISLSEQPKIYVDENEVDFDIDLTILNSQKNAYGEIFVIPNFFEDKMVLDLKNKWLPDVEYLIQRGELVFLKYTTIEKIKDKESGEIKDIKFIIEHKKEDGKHIKIIKNHDDEFVKRFENDIISFPFISSLKTINQTGKPIYYEAINHINAVDRALNDIETDREMSKKRIFLPEGMSNKHKERGLERGITMNTNRLFRKLPTKNDDDLKPITWEGTWEPQKFIDYINFRMNLISLFCGFGNKYLSYDYGTSFKTATQVVSEKDDIYKNKMLFDQQLKQVYTKLLQIYFKEIKGEDLNVERINIIFSDSIITNDEQKRKNYENDFKLGILDAKTYMKLVGYSQDVIDEVMSKKIAFPLES